MCTAGVQAQRTPHRSAVLSALLLEHITAKEGHPVRRNVLPLALYVSREVKGWQSQPWPHSTGQAQHRASTAGQHWGQHSSQSTGARLGPSWTAYLARDVASLRPGALASVLYMQPAQAGLAERCPPECCRRATAMD